MGKNRNELNANTFCADDIVRVRSTGRIGRVTEAYDRLVQVEFRDSVKEDSEEKQMAVSRLEHFDMPVAEPEAVRAFVRGESELVSFVRDTGFPLDRKPDEAYVVTAEDLLAGIRNVKEESRKAKRWIDQLLYWDDEDSGETIWPQDDDRRLLSEDGVVLFAESVLDDAAFALEEGDPEEFGKSLQEAEDSLSAWLSAGADLSRIGEYPDGMLFFLTADEHDGNIDGRSREEQEVFRACLDELCVRGDVAAVTKRGYCWYCGTEVYPQNWEAARDAFLFVYEQTGEAWAANTLGYIFYYGRCNGGVPQYEKALHWFSIGHANGIQESTYKLGDLYANGFGVLKNEDTAHSLYWQVYQDTLNTFLKDIRDSKFADAAIRMGNCCRDGIGCSVELKKAYGYYLQARLALDLRKDYGLFGDESVRSRLEESMRKIRETRGEKAASFPEESPFWLKWMLDRDHRACLMTWKAMKDGRFALSFVRAPDTENESDFILATVPEADYCRRLRKITVKTDRNASLTVKEGAGEVLFDDYVYFWRDNRLELRRTGETVAVIFSGKYSVHRPSGEQEEGRRRKPGNTDKGTWQKGDLEVVKLVVDGKVVDLSLQQKQPLKVQPKHARQLKVYKDIDEFQKEYDSKEAREAFVSKLRNDEIDELIDLCGSIQGKNYYDLQKKQEKIFEYGKSPALNPFGGTRLAVYDGPGAEKYVEFGDGFLDRKTVRIGRKEISLIRAALEDNALFEAETLEGPYSCLILDGMSYCFSFAVKGCENEMFGSNIEDCREDFEHCMHSAHVIRALEEIRDILDGKGIPKEYFEL